MDGELYWKARCPGCRTANWFYYGDPNDCTTYSDVEHDLFCCYACGHTCVMLDENTDTELWSELAEEEGIPLEQWKEENLTVAVGKPTPE